MAIQNIEVEFKEDGTAIVRKGDGTSFKVTDPAKLAKLMEQLATKLGPIIERHAAHSHIHLDAGTGKMVSEEHEHS